MELVELLSTIKDTTFVAIWYDGNIVSEYDGKNSIDEKWNNYLVNEVSCRMKHGNLWMDILVKER